MERRALVVDLHATGEWLPDGVFTELERAGRGRWTPDSFFEATAAGQLALAVCPVEPASG